MRSPRIKQHRRRAIVGALAMVMLLAACGENGSEPDTATSETEEEEEEGTADAAEEAEEEETVEAAESLTLRFAHTTPIPNTVWEEAVDDFKTAVEEATDGRVEVDIVRDVVAPNDILPALAEGRADAGNLVNAYTAATYPLWDVASLPGLMSDDDDVQGILSDIVKPAINAQIQEEFGVTAAVITTFPNAMYWTADTPINDIEDFQGLQLRSHGAAVSEMLNAVGASPVGMEFPEVYSSIERGVVDGNSSALSSFLGASLYEVIDYANEWPAGHASYVLFVANDFLDQLPEGDAELVMAALEDLETALWDRHIEVDDDHRQQLADEGIEFIVPTDEQLAEFQEIAEENVWSWWLESTGEEGERLLNDILSVTNN